MITAVQPRWALPGGRVLLEGRDLPLRPDGPPEVRVGGDRAHVVSASVTRLRIVVPPTVEGGTLAIAINGEVSDGRAAVEVAHPLATGVHQVDSPAFDGLGRLYVTQSGTRGSKAAVPLFRVARDGTREPIAVDIANPTSLALGPDGAMYVSSRFESTVYRLTSDDRAEVYASELGVPTGLAFGRDGVLFVGDRSGSVFRVSPDRRVDVFATLPSSVAAFHLAVGPDDALYVTAPTLASHDPVYRITPTQAVHTVSDGFGRPQGLAFDKSGSLYVVDALAGAAGLYRLDQAAARPPELVLAAPNLIGLAFDPAGGLVLASHDTIWRLDIDAAPLPPPA
jgi:sugar lactone lactonase YvrE